MFKNKFKKLTVLFLAAVMTLVALPIQTLASEWGVGDNVYAAMLGNYIGSDNGTYGDKRVSANTANLKNMSGASPCRTSNKPQKKEIPPKSL